MSSGISSRDHASALVLNVVREKMGQNWILETSRIEEDLGLDPPAARARLYPAIRDRIIVAETSDELFTPEAVSSATTIKDIVDSVWAAASDPGGLPGDDTTNA